jgi:hypothetical protein
MEAAPEAEETQAMSAQDQIVDAVMARALQVDAVRTHPLVAWVVTRDAVAYPGEFVARLVTDAPTPYVLLAETLAGLEAQMPNGLIRTDRQPADPPEVVEVWFPDVDEAPTA